MHVARFVTEDKRAATPALVVIMIAMSAGDVRATVQRCVSKRGPCKALSVAWCAASLMLPSRTSAAPLWVWPSAVITITTHPINTPHHRQPIHLRRGNPSELPRFLGGKDELHPFPQALDEINMSQPRACPSIRTVV